MVAKESCPIGILYRVGGPRADKPARGGYHHRAGSAPMRQHHPEVFPGIPSPLTGAIGVGVEWWITRTGTYCYLHTSVESLHIESLPVPILLPFLYIAASIGVGNLGRFYAFGEDGVPDSAVPPAAPALSA